MTSKPHGLAPHGRGAGFNPPNRFEKLHVEPFHDEWAEEEDFVRKVPTTFFLDNTKSILAKNDSPDLGFTYSINPYRGCEHGCIYCYARPTHEYLGFSAGVDFESKILVKLDAPQLLERIFLKKSWVPQVIAFSGNTDCYQPIERKLQLTRKCLEVFLKFRNPVSIITKNFLITRDLDILCEMASLNLVLVIVSVTSLDHDLIRVMEPRTSTPQKRLEAIEQLAEAGIHVGVNAAPIIPGLTDEKIPNILREASARGAKFAGWTMVRLPGAVKPLFLDWLQREFPLKAKKILNRLQDVRGGKLSDNRFGTRFTGEGEIASTIQQIFDASCKKYHLNEGRIHLSTEYFRRVTSDQKELFSHTF